MAFILTFISSSCFSHTNLGSKEVLLDNEKVEVVRATYPAGTESGIHTHQHPNRVVYVIQGGKLELTGKDKTKPAKVLDIVAGQTLYLPATTHNVKNIGTTEVVIIETEIK